MLNDGAISKISGKAGAIQIARARSQHSGAQNPMRVAAVYGSKSVKITDLIVIALQLLPAVNEAGRELGESWATIT